MSKADSKSAPSHAPFIDPRQLRLGLRANWRQFSLLVLVNAFVGGMVGLERAVLPVLAEQEFGLASRAAILSFIVSFGVVKALANLAAGRLSDRYGRKRVLLAGWLVGLPVPLLIILAPTWGWVVFANVLLGINQGLCWSTTVIMKVDLVGTEHRGLAMGLNEFAGYGAVSLAALGSAYLAASFGLRPYPFLPGLAFAMAGLLLTAFFVEETKAYAHNEGAQRAALDPESGVGHGAQLSFFQVFLLTSWKDRALFSVSQAGLVNNLNDGLAWGLFPLIFAAAGLPIEQIGILTALYPGVWGMTQLLTGALSDRLGRKRLIVSGMWLQAGSIGLVLLGQGFTLWAVAMVGLGLGTALVYPTFLAAVADVTQPEWRASAIGTYRLWRDVGYAVGALLAGMLADLLSVPAAVGAVAVLTFVSGTIAAFTMYETRPPRARMSESSGPVVLS
ncbi:MAG: MFS transporter [Chloroflexi bacterium]|nr:MFS transporter [Chloroflexota bacterium]